jgi:hypothetical protein
MRYAYYIKPKFCVRYFEESDLTWNLNSLFNITINISKFIVYSSNLIFYLNEDTCD